MPERITRANPAKSKVRADIERVFAWEKGRWRWSRAPSERGEFITHQIDEAVLLADDALVSARCVTIENVVSAEEFPDATYRFPGPRL